MEARVWCSFCSFFRYAFIRSFVRGWLLLKSFKTSQTRSSDILAFHFFAIWAIIFFLYSTSMLIFVYFRPFDNTMTNVVYNLKLNCAWDLNPGLRMVGADKSTELWRPPRPLSAPPLIQVYAFALSLAFSSIRSFNLLLCFIPLILCKKTFPMCRIQTGTFISKSFIVSNQKSWKAS